MEGKHHIILAILGIFLFNITVASAQKVAFVVSDVIRDNFPEARQSEQRIKSIVEDWKRELEAIDRRIEDLKQEIAKNRLIWSDEEKRTKEKELSDQNITRLEFSRKKFEPGGEYDQTVRAMMKPVEEKIYATVQQVAADEGFDIVLDKSVHSLPYSNPKYDLTVKVLRKLGVDVRKLEAELQEKIAKDPANQKKESKEAPGARRKSRSRKSSDTDIEKNISPEPFDKQEEEQPKDPLNPANNVLPDSLKPILR